MIRAVRVADDRLGYVFTRRGVIGLIVASALMLTALVLAVIALFGLSADSRGMDRQTQRILTLSDENSALISDLHQEVEREYVRVREARDAYCRLKHYETLSGGAVLRIAAGFRLLSPHAQDRWRLALRAVAHIPAARSCSGTALGLSGRRSPSAHSATSGLVRAPSEGIPTRAPRRRAPGPGARVPPRPVSPTPAAPAASATSPASPAPTAPGTPATPVTPPLLPPVIAEIKDKVVNPAGHEPSGLQHKLEAKIN